MTDAASAPPRGPKLRWQEATITAIHPDTPRVKSFMLQPAPFSFRSGQHVDVRLTAPDGYAAERSYSIASAPEHSAGIELAIERLDHGEVSSLLPRRCANRRHHRAARADRRPFRVGG